MLIGLIIRDNFLIQVTQSPKYHFREKEVTKPKYTLLEGIPGVARGSAIVHYSYR